MHETIMFVVVATHGTGHGDVSSVVLVTDSPGKALKVARRVEKMAYEFLTPEDHGVVIERVAVGTVYDHLPGDITRKHSDPTNSDALVYGRCLHRDWSLGSPVVKWREEFFNGWTGQ